jgi:adenylyltransferase/sulfurtransferase
VEPATELTTDEVRRYSRHLIIPDVGMEGQKRLKNAKVLIIGAGGLGSPALLYLAAAGVGTLGVIDFDTVDESNLQRQVIHGQSDIGKSKTASAAETVAEVNPLVDVVCHDVALDNDNVFDIFGQYDLILDGTDNFATRYLVNDAAVLLGKPYVWGSIFRFEGQVSVFWDEHGPNYRDLYPVPPPPGMVPSCAEGGVLGILCSSIGSIMVTEAIKLITGIGEPLIGRLMIYDALEMSFQTLNLAKDPNAEPITELIDYDDFCGAVTDEAADAIAGHTISVQQLRDWLDARDRGERDFELIDVREPVEREINQIPGSVLIPKGEFQNGTALGQLPQDKQVVLYCKGGTRSAECLAAVHGAGLADAVHVGGGVSSWVSEVDPSQTAY